jgi:hypothetical protein
MSKSIVTMLGNALSRRSFLSRAVSATGALLVGVVATPRHAGATTLVGCCWLCITNCTYDASQCASQWRWGCCHQWRRKWCYECFAPGYQCTGGSCDGVICSKIEDIGPVQGPDCPDTIDTCL